MEVDGGISCSNEIVSSLPKLCRSDYYTEPCISQLAIREQMNPGYCSRVQDFVIGRVDYGRVKFFGETDVRGLDLDRVIRFGKHNVIILHDDNLEPPSVCSGLNKPAEVTFLLPVGPLNENHVREIVDRLKTVTESQGAQFLSFDLLRGEWKFVVQHFSRYGLNKGDVDGILKIFAGAKARHAAEKARDAAATARDASAKARDASAKARDAAVKARDAAAEARDAAAKARDASPMVQDASNINGRELSPDVDARVSVSVNEAHLSHSLPAHLGLNPSKMKELRMLMFPSEEDEFEGLSGGGRLSHNSTEEFSRSPFHHSSSKASRKENGAAIRKTPLALLEHNKYFKHKASKQQGFVMELKDNVTESQLSNNIVDAALFMGRSFRVGWGPNGVLVHSGMPFDTTESPPILSSVINIEKVFIDKVARDESNNVSEEASDLCFVALLELHRELDHEDRNVEIGNFELNLQKLVCDRFALPDICRRYIDIVEKQLELPGVPSVSRVLLMHQVSIWELIKVLFSSRNVTDADEEALPLIRRAEFSYWLQESVYHRVQEEVSSLEESSDLLHIFLLLTGRQLDTAVELAASRGDVRLSCLLSGSPANRDDISHQLDMWRKNGFDFKFIEMDRLRIFELLSGNIHGAKIDWKRFLGLLMWYHLPPHTSLPVVFNTYQKLVNEGNAPNPVPVYVDEGNGNDHFDLGYYLMLLHARQESDFGALKTMLSASASTNDPLDYHMIWHHRAILEAIGLFSCNDLHVLDMAFVSQLLCVGQCHWAIYVVLHMPHREDFPYLQATVVREILFRYCEVWSSQEEQWRFIEDLGVPSPWLHEALAIYFNYMGDLSKALHHFMKCENWQKAHSLFVTSVAYPLFFSAKHTEIWQLATSMEDHKSEIEDWDLGAGIYISFYLLRNSLHEESNSMNIIEEKNDACSDFIGRLNKSMVVWGSRLSLENRVVYSKMAEEISSSLYLMNAAEVQKQSSFDAVFKGPMLRSCHLQDAVALFITCLSQ